MEVVNFDVEAVWTRVEVVIFDVEAVIFNVEVLILHVEVVWARVEVVSLGSSIKLAVEDLADDGEAAEAFGAAAGDGEHWFDERDEVGFAAIDRLERECSGGF